MFDAPEAASQARAEGTVVIELVMNRAHAHSVTRLYLRVPPGVVLLSPDRHSGARVTCI